MGPIKKILFIVPPLLKETVEFYPDFPTPPLGIGYICANTSREIEKDILDLTFIQNWDDVWASMDSLPDYDLYAFTSMTPNFPNTLKVAQRLKRRRHGLVVIGGNHITVAPKEVLDTNVFDLGIVGEGEDTFRELLANLNRGTPVEHMPGLVFKGTDGKIVKTGRRKYVKNLDTLHFPARHLLPMHDYFQCFSDIIPEERGTTLLCSRGCPFSCSFCSKEIFGSRYRYRSPENIEEEIRHLIDAYQVNMIHFVDDTFTTNHAFVERLCDTLIQQKFPVQWQCESRVDSVNRNLVKKMKKAGCKRIMYGIESGSPRILEKMKKNIRPEMVIEAFAWAKAENIDTGAFIMLGYPGESKETLQETRRIVEQVHPKYISVSFTTILPGTQLHQEYCTTANWKTKTFNDYHIGSNIKLDGIDFHDLVDTRDKIFDIIKSG